MRIGIDIDGVLTDIEKFQIEYGSKYFCNKKTINPNAYYTTDAFGITLEEDNEFWNSAILEYIKVPARNYAGEVIKKLKKEGNEIYIITARSSDLSYSKTINSSKMKIIVKKWLKKYNINYDKLIFSKEDKLSICLKNKIDIMIEDKPYNINELSNYFPVICYNTNYNSQCNSNNIIRCYSWYDIYYKIKDI